MKEHEHYSLSTRILERIQYSENTAPAVVAMIVGLLAGFGAIAFRYLIRGVQWLFFGGGAQLSERLAFLHLGRAFVILAPAVGLLAVSWIVRRWAIEAQGHGVPEVQYAIMRRGGRIRLRVAFIKVIASALCIGSGGSVGREGPIVQIGSSLASALARVTRLRGSDIKILVAAGAAGGIGATFNAPIAGVMFALEVVLGSFAARSFGLVVISSVSAVAVSHAFLGKQPAFRLIQQFDLHSHWELFLYLALGLAAGVISLAYVRSVYFFEHVFERWKANYNIKAFTGGLAVGAMGYFGSEHIFGVGYESVEMALQGNFAIQLLLMLIILKMLATSVTLGAGGSGGVFAPALFIGAMAGSAFGFGANQLFPSVTAPAGAYALVGMAALFAGAAHAPITSILILFEMTDDYRIILPLMLSAVVSYLVVSKLSPDTIYSVKLRRLGGFTPHRKETSILDTILVADAMTAEYRTVSPELPIADAIQLFRQTAIRSCPVVDSANHLVGIVTESDIEAAVVEERVEGYTVSDIMAINPVTCTPDASLRVTLLQFGERDVDQILVVDKEHPHRLVGLLLRSEILWAYSELADEHRRLLSRTGVGIRAEHEDSVRVEVQIRSGQSRICFKRIRDIKVPSYCLIATIRRGDRTVVPRGDTVIEPGDILVLFTVRSHDRQLRDWLAHLLEEPRGSHSSFR